MSALNDFLDHEIGTPENVINEYLKEDNSSLDAETDKIMDEITKGDQSWRNTVRERFIKWLRDCAADFEMRGLKVAYDKNLAIVADLELSGKDLSNPELSEFVLRTWKIGE